MPNLNDLHYENIISDNILLSPFTHYIDELYKRDGIDSSDLRRKISATGGSALMGYVGSLISGPLGIIMGLMGYAAGMAVRFDDEGKEDKMLEAALRAGKRLKETVPNYIIDEIYDDLIEFIDTHDTNSYTAKESLKIIYSIIYNVDPKAANLWVVNLMDEL